MTDPRLVAPAVASNRHLILDVLCQILPAKGVVLEIASGSGELPGLTFQPSDPTPVARESMNSD